MGFRKHPPSRQLGNEPHSRLSHGDHPTCGTLRLKSRSQKRANDGTKDLAGLRYRLISTYVVTDVLGTLRYEGYSYADQTFSELTAQEAPTRPLMVALNGIPYSLLVAAFTGGVYTSAGPKRAARITGAMLLGYAAFGFAGGRGEEPTIVR